MAALPWDEATVRRLYEITVTRARVALGSVALAADVGESGVEVMRGVTMGDGVCVGKQEGTLKAGCGEWSGR